VGSIISAAGGGVAAFGQFQDSKTDLILGAQNYKAGLIAAADATDRGRVASGALARKQGQQIGQAQVALAASGVDTQSGTALQDIAKSRANADLDRLTLENNAAREAWGYKVKAVNAWQQGQVQSARDFMNSIGSDLGASTGGGHASGDAASIASFLA
jgi:hypothetical protein